MIVRKSKGLYVSETILGHLIPALEDELKDEARCYIQSYQNGREQGLALSVHYKGRSHWLAFCEHRPSDNLVVYDSDCDPMQSITDEIYSSGKHFDVHCEYAAAQYAFRLIQQKLGL